MTESELKDKVYASYVEEFAAPRDLSDFRSLQIVIKGSFAYVQYHSLKYYCRLTSKGVKKHSWRMD